MAKDRKDEFDRLAFAHFRELRRVAFRVCENLETADDLVQETYLRAWRSFDRFEPGSNCRAWLFKIFFYVRSEHRRTQARQPLVFPLDRVKESTVAYETQSVAAAALAEVRQAFSEVPEPFRTVLLLADIEGFRYREIADVLEIPIGTVMSRLSRARKILRDRLSSAAATVGQKFGVEKGRKSGRF